MHLPLALTPWGWVVLGAAGYLVYRAGKKAGEKAAEKDDKKPKKS